MILTTDIADLFNKFLQGKWLPVGSKCQGDPLSTMLEVKKRKESRGTKELGGGADFSEKKHKRSSNF